MFVVADKSFTYLHLLFQFVGFYFINLLASTIYTLCQLCFGRTYNQSLTLCFIVSNFRITSNKKPYYHVPCGDFGAILR